MRVFPLNSCERGWFIGNFYPSVLHTKDFEVACLKLPKGYIGDKHYHKIATEYNLLIYGKVKVKYSWQVTNGHTNENMIINDEAIISGGNIFVYEPEEVSDVEYLDDSCVITIKVPSVPNDKYKV